MSDSEWQQLELDISNSEKRAGIISLVLSRHIQSLGVVPALVIG